MQGMQRAWAADLELPQPRDPDALPPRNGAKWALGVLYHGAAALERICCLALSYKGTSISMINNVVHNNNRDS